MRLVCGEMGRQEVVFCFADVAMEERFVGVGDGREEP
jgi:hypothetical protein